MERDYVLLRIERKDSPPNHTILRLAGRLGASQLENLLQSVDPCLDSGRKVELDLVDLRFLDEQGALLLCALQERGAMLTHPSGYAVQLLRAVKETQ